VKKSLVIHWTQSSCGCTQVDFEKAPVRPKKNAEINFIMTPDSKSFFIKPLEVYRNTKDSLILLSVKGITE